MIGAYVPMMISDKPASLKILLLEDNADLARMLRQILEWRGYEVVVGASGEEGLEALEHASTPPDLILCDLIMPDMDGHEFMRHVRQHYQWSSIPLVIMSASVAPEDQATVLKEGANGFLGKPFGISELDELIAEVGLSS